MTKPPLTPLEASFLRRTLGPALLILFTPPVAILLWMICAHYDGSIQRLVTGFDLDAFLTFVPRPTLSALGILGFFVVLQGLLLAFLPGKAYLGPVTPTGTQPRYKNNGVLAWFVTHLGLVGAWRLGLWSAATVVHGLGEMLVLLTGLAFVFCMFLYWKGLNRPTSPDRTYTGHLLFDFFQGIELHPTLFGMNLKQLINCRVSMMGWSMLLVCFALYQQETNGAIATSMWVSAGLLVAYLFKFFVWETGYFTSLDIMHDRFGYYICWGVLVWVPSVYTIFGQYFAHHPIALSPFATVGITALGLAALWMNYAADAQRQRVRATAGQTTVWGQPSRTLTARYRTSDGTERENLLLVSGYWGLARHFHYVPELTLALCWALPAGRAAFVPYFYFVFLTCLLVDRANRDDKRCCNKYGEAWLEYRKLVPWKILPGVY